jgi:hypothetical protein
LRNKTCYSYRPLYYLSAHIHIHATDTQIHTILLSFQSKKEANLVAFTFYLLNKTVWEGPWPYNKSGELELKFDIQTHSLLPFMRCLPPQFHMSWSWELWKDFKDYWWQYNRLNIFEFLEGRWETLRKMEVARENTSLWKRR